MRVTVCDPESFYPLRNLVAGPLTDRHELTAVERFVRTVVLHDEISMELAAAALRSSSLNMTAGKSSAPGDVS